MKKHLFRLALLLASTTVLAATTPVKLQIVPNTKFTDGTAIPVTAKVTYSLYGAKCSAARPLPLLASGIADPKLDPALVRSASVGDKHCYAATETVDGVTSDLSPELVIDLTVPAPPPPKPAAPTLAPG